jgi:glycosyltransferase involved in cell wall biosynthesis
MMKVSFSVLIRTLNEADRLGRALDAVSAFGQEIVVIDSGSTDGTQALAIATGARVIEHRWEGFGPQRSFGESACTNDWIFYIDADEVPTPALIEEVKELFAKGEPPHVAYEVRNTMVLPGFSKPHWFADVRKVTRLTNRNYARVTSDPSWDTVAIDAGKSLGALKNRQCHYCFRNWSHAINKIGYTSSLASETQKKKPLLSLLIRLIMELPLEFLKFYLVRLFIFGGWRGFAFSVVQAFARFARILKMVEKNVS